MRDREQERHYYSVQHRLDLERRGQIGCGILSTVGLGLVGIAVANEQPRLPLLIGAGIAFVVGYILRQIGEIKSSNISDEIRARISEREHENWLNSSNEPGSNG